MIKVAVTDQEYDKAPAVFGSAAESGFACLRAPTAEAELAEVIRREGATDAIVGVAAYTGPLYEALPAGGVIARFGVGHDGIHKALATARGLLCTNTPGVLDDSVAEHAVTLMLAAARRLLEVAGPANGWSPQVGCEVRGKTLAVIGCGAIGRRVARIAARGFGMRVVGCDIAEMEVSDLIGQFGFSKLTRSFAEAVADADFVSLHIPATPATHHFISAPRLEKLAPGAWLINTARGSLVDEAALYDAIAAGRLGGAALDVFEREPYEPVRADKDLRTLPRVILTPHVGSSTREACERMAARALQNIRLAHEKRFDEMDLLNPEVCRGSNTAGS